MKQVLDDRIINIDKNLFDNKFLFYYQKTDYSSKDIEVFFMWDLLLDKENTQLLLNIKDKYASYSNVYSSDDEFDIFCDLFNYAISKNKKIHIVWVTLKKEIEMLEEYYEKLWFLREDINCFNVDFRVPLVTVSVNIENLMWRWSDYKRMKEEIFFIPPIRESWETKAMFKWINRWVIANINIWKLTKEKINFLQNTLVSEHILPLTLSKVLYYNISNIWFSWEKQEIILKY